MTDARLEYYRQYYKKNRERIRQTKRNHAKRAYATNVERERERGRKAYHANKDAFRRRHLLRTFGLSLEQYEQLLKMQDYSCTICFTNDPGRGSKHWCVDHDHNTKEVRGLLCHDCNAGLGHFQDNRNKLAAAISYLQAPPAGFFLDNSNA